MQHQDRVFGFFIIGTWDDGEMQLDHRAVFFVPVFGHQDITALGLARGFGEKLALGDLVARPVEGAAGGQGSNQEQGAGPQDQVFFADLDVMDIITPHLTIL